MALAVLAGFYLALRRAPQYGINLTDAEDIIFWLIIGGFIGARLYHVASSFTYYLHHPLQSLEVWKGGLSIYGAVIGGICTLWLIKKLLPIACSLFTLLDWLAPSLVLGQIIGRFGNFFNYELYGYPTNLPWKMFVPLSFRLPGYQNFSYFQPLFLYEVLANLIILSLLLWWSSLPKRKGAGTGDPVRSRSHSVFAARTVVFVRGRLGVWQTQQGSGNPRRAFLFLPFVV